MSVAIGILAALVWLVCLFAFVRVALAWLRILRLVPSGQRMSAAFELGFLNFPAIEARIGAAAIQPLQAYRQGFLLFFGGVGIFMVLVILNIVSGNAA